MLKKFKNVDCQKTKITMLKRKCRVRGTLLLGSLTHLLHYCLYSSIIFGRKKMNYWHGSKFDRDACAGFESRQHRVEVFSLEEFCYRYLKNVPIW